MIATLLLANVLARLLPELDADFTLTRDSRPAPSALSQHTLDNWQSVRWMPPDCANKGRHHFKTQSDVKYPLSLSLIWAHVFLLAALRGRTPKKSDISTQCCCCFSSIPCKLCRIIPQQQSASFLKIHDLATPVLLVTVLFNSHTNFVLCYR